MQTKHIDATELQLDESQYLGIGTYGLVKRGVWRNRQVAVKYLRQKKDQSSFLRELKQLCACDHENIVRIFGANKEENFFVMEFADCGTLCRVVHNMPEVSYTLSHAIKWAVQAGDAVAYLHSQKPRPIVHRDLKPLNLLLFHAGRVLKVCDFGTARTADSVMSNLKGTCLWMAPEVCGPKEQSGPFSKYSEKCDVFSWGIILWEMLARKRPYESDFEMRDTIKIMLHVVLEHGRPRQLAGCPQELNDLITSCWAQSPEERPSMRDCVRLLSMLIPHLVGYSDPLVLPGAAADDGRVGSQSAVASPSVTEEPPPATVSRHDTNEMGSEGSEGTEGSDLEEAEPAAGPQPDAEGKEAQDGAGDRGTLVRAREDGAPGQEILSRTSADLELGDDWEIMDREEALTPFHQDLAGRTELMALDPIPGNAASQQIYDSHQERLQEFVQLMKAIAVEEQKRHDIDQKLRKSCQDDEEWLRIEEYMQMMLEIEEINNRQGRQTQQDRRGQM